MVDKRKESSFSVNFSQKKREIDVERKSKKIKRLKLFLPSICAILVGLIFVWPKIISQKDQFSISMIKPQKGEIEKLKMEKAKFFGTDKKNQLYSITADLAEEVDAKKGVVLLKNPKADILFNKGSFIAATASKGYLYQKEEKLELEGVVDVFHDEGYQAQIKKAVFDLKTGELSSKHDFVAFGPLGKIKSQGLKIINKGKKKGKVVIFTKKAKMVLFFDKMAKNK